MQNTQRHIPILKPQRVTKKPVSKLTRGGSLKPVSCKRVKLNKMYSVLRKKFLEERPICEWWLNENGWIEQNGYYSNFKLGTMRCSMGWLVHKFSAPFSCDIHHMKGRGKYFLDVSTWMAVSRAGHDKIHASPSESYAKGYMMPRN